MTDDLQLLRDFRRDVPAPDEETARRIYRLATAAHPRRRGRFRLGWRRRPRLLVAVVAAALAIAGGASALAVHYLGPSSPGFTAGFSAYDRLPPAAWPSSLPRVGLDRAAGYMGVSTTDFQQGLRLLRSGLTLGPGRSQGEGKLYAYIGDDYTAACMFLTGQGGGCVNAANAPRVHGLMSHLFPGYPGQTPAAVAIVADNVKSVDLVINRKSTNVPIINNSIYADLNGLQADDPIELHATYEDGSTWVYPLFNPKGERRRPEQLIPHAG
jgi:hypothetical protein